MGNLVYRKAMRNFNPMMATAASTTIAEVYEVVDAGKFQDRCRIHCSREIS
jgi:3-oxoadipate CoA-transferase alpha subunit